MNLPCLSYCSVALLASVALFFAGCDRSTPIAERTEPGDDVTITQADFDATISQSDRAVLVKFGAPWCGPCRMIDDELPAVVSELGDEIEILRINVDNNPELAQAYGARAIPKMVLFRNGEIVSDRVGYMDAENLSQWILNSK